MNKLKSKMKLYACSSGKSLSGLTRIINLVKNDIDVQRLWNIAEIDSVYQEEDFKILLHNICCINPEIRRKSIIFGLYSIVATLQKKRYRLDFLENPPLDLWVNSRTAKEALSKVGIVAKLMYRPNQIKFSEYTEKPIERRILWYWKESRPDFRQHREVVARVVNRLPEIQFIFFPVNRAPVQAKNVTILDRINVAEYSKSVLGMIRISSAFDLGRSIFEVIANGRWVLTYKLDELFTVTVDDLNQLEDRIIDCCENFSDEDGATLHYYAMQNFAEEVLQNRWVAALEQVIKN